MKRPIERRQVVQGNKAYGNPYKNEKLSVGSAGRLEAIGGGVKRVTEKTESKGIRVFGADSVVSKLNKFETLSQEVGNPKADKSPVQKSNSLIDDILGGE